MQHTKLCVLVEENLSFFLIIESFYADTKLKDHMINCELMSSPGTGTDLFKK